MFSFQDGAICLHEAAKQGHVSVVKSLLMKGAMVNVMTKVGFIVLCCSINVFIISFLPENRDFV